MTTKGNLELRVGESTFFASASADGYNVYKIVPKLVEFLDESENPSVGMFKEWFEVTSREIISKDCYSERLIGGVPHEVIIDVRRKLLLHNGHDEAFGVVLGTRNFGKQFENACILLKEKFGYEVIEYVNEAIRKMMEDEADRFRR